MVSYSWPMKWLILAMHCENYWALWLWLLFSLNARDFDDLSFYCSAVDHFLPLDYHLRNIFKIKHWPFLYSKLSVPFFTGRFLTIFSCCQGTSVFILFFPLLLSTHITFKNIFYTTSWVSASVGIKAWMLLAVMMIITDKCIPFIIK